MIKDTFDKSQANHHIGENEKLMDDHISQKMQLFAQRLLGSICHEVKRGRNSAELVSEGKYGIEFKFSGIIILIRYESLSNVNVTRQSKIAVYYKSVNLRGEHEYMLFENVFAGGYGLIYCDDNNTLSFASFVESIEFSNIMFENLAIRVLKAIEQAMYESTIEVVWYEPTEDIHKNT